MSTITKEQAKDLRNAFLCWQQHYDPVEDKEQYDMFGLGMVAMDVLLASLEAEAAYFINRVKHSDAYGDDVELRTYCYELDALKSKDDFGGEIVPVYTVPPAPVSVPDEMTMQKALSAIDQLSWQECTRDAYMLGWNACRAAMLQGADGNSPVIPDGSEDTKRLDWLDAQNKRLNEYYGTTYGWKFDANFQRNAMMLNDSNYPVMTVRQAIDEAIAAAPQQEVK